MAFDRNGYFVQGIRPWRPHFVQVPTVQLGSFVTLRGRRLVTVASPLSYETAYRNV